MVSIVVFGHLEKTTYPMIIRNCLYIALIPYFLLAACSPAAEQDKFATYDPDYRFPVDSLETNIHESVRYLLNNLRLSGQFYYRRNLDRSVRIDGDDYNELRHLGAIYSLGQYAEAFPDTELAEPMRRAGDFMRNCCLSPFPDENSPQLALWTDPEINGGLRERRVKLGGNGLGLLAFVTIEREAGNYMSKDTLARLAASILEMQNADGSFKSVYESDGERYSEFESLFYPGEAVLGLLQLYRHDADQRWLDAAIRGLRHICQSRQDMAIEDLPSDHWALLATAELFEHIPAEKYAADRQCFHDHGRRVIERMVTAQRIEPADSVYFGSFNGVGNTTPIGTKMEGMIAFGPYLEDVSPEFEQRLKTSIHYGLRYLQGARVTSGPFQGGVTYLPAAVLPTKKKAKEVYTCIQIDNVQHVLSGWIWARKHADWLWGR